MLRDRLPPLDPLVAFEAAARLLSFTRAGEELHITQAAVSQQIRNLEQTLEVQLFTRSHRAVQLTREGREYQHTVSAIFNQLASATLDIKSVELAQQLVIGSDQSFATQFLSPRLRRLQTALPQTVLRMVVSDNESECLASDVQASILHGDGNWPGFVSMHLFDEEIFPVCSPDYAHDIIDNNWTDWLLQAELIELDDNHWKWMNWRLWLGGNDIDQPLRQRNLQINHYPLVIEAACNGQGVALGWRYLVDDLLAAGKLIRPIEQTLKTDFGYYLIYRPQLADDPALSRFRDWLLGEFNQPGSTR
ncbi:MAG: LysR family glycine cleavage system transcriptional activator [Gammaproteobacteria bacterium]|jgi:LysR family glycine cleavage system transcriptional activator